MPGELNSILGIIEYNNLSTQDKHCYDQIKTAQEQIDTYFSQYNTWDQDKAGWEGQREEYGKKLNDIAIDYYLASIPLGTLFGAHNVVRQNKESELNNQYPSRVTQFTAFPDSPPVFFMNTNFDCMACQNQVSTGKMTDSMLEISQTTQCLINRVKDQEATALENQADQLDQQGRHDEAEELRRRAAEARTLSEAAAVEADRVKYLLKANPGWIVLATTIALLVLIFLAAIAVIFLM